MNPKEEPRECAAQIAELYQNQRDCGKGSEVQELERFRAGRHICQPG